MICSFSGIVHPYTNKTNKSMDWKKKTTKQNESFWEMHSRSHEGKHLGKCFFFLAKTQMFVLISIQKWWICAGFMQDKRLRKKKFVVFLFILFVCF